MITSYIIAMFSAVLIDGVWLGVISKSLYQQYIGDLMLKQAHIFPAIVFYVIFAAAITVFIIDPALKSGWTTGQVVFHGALLGLVIYGGYDLTNLAILKNWPITISIIDMAWGVTLTTLVSVITLYLTKFF